MKAAACSAPGKLFLGGEYAVLHGAEAVITAIDRRVSAFPVPGKGSDSPVLALVREHAARLFAAEGAVKPPIPELRVQSRQFRIGGQKIGLGSSAAVGAAAAGALFEWAGLEIEGHRREILALAASAHRESQGGKGSGADVAASVYGGTILYAIDGRAEPVDTRSVVLVPVWSGQAASTPELIGRIDAFAKSDPRGHRVLFDALAAGAALLASAYRKGDPAAIIAATRQYGEEMGALGRAAGADIVTRAHAIIANLAASLGGAAKPSGAGGGDAAVAVFSESSAARCFRTQCRRHGLTPLELKTGAPGLRRDDRPDGSATAS